MTTIGGRYLLDRQIADGGMGAVWVARDTLLGRRVALKLIRPEHRDLPHLRQLFEREACIVAQLQHPNVVQIYDYGFDQQAPYLVMELLTGEDLASRLARQQRLSLPAAVALLSQAARGLSAAHAAGVIHRDLKPANIFLTRSESREVVKLLDFGLAVSGVAPEGDMLLAGTPQYMSPEQIRAATDLDGRSDLFSLAIVAYEALTGRQPFASEQYHVILQQILNEDYAIPPPSTLVEGLGPAVDAFFARALCRRREGRFQSAREMNQALCALEDAVPAGRPARILAVDDEPDVPVLIRQGLRHRIRQSVYEFLFASDGEEALDQLRRHPDIDLVLSDINMPRLNGLELVSRVAEINPLLRVVIISAYGDMSNLRQAMNRGAFDFVLKPIDFQDLDRTLDKTLRHVRAARRALRWAEENEVLRLLLGSGGGERVAPALQAAGWLSGEHLQATVVHVRLAGAAARPPVERLALLNRAFDIILPEISAYRGVVERLSGDAAVALFQGDNHQQRALLSCFSLREQAQAQAAQATTPADWDLAIGADTGAVLTGRIGARAAGRADLALLGEPVERAARLAALAAPGQILISGALLPALSASCEIERMPAEPPDGPEAYRVLSPHQTWISTAQTRIL